MVPGQVEVCVEIRSPGTIPNPANVNFVTQDGSATGTNAAWQSLEEILIPSLSLSQLEWTM